MLSAARTSLTPDWNWGTGCYFSLQWNIINNIQSVVNKRQAIQFKWFLMPLSLPVNDIITDRKWWTSSDVPMSKHSFGDLTLAEHTEVRQIWKASAGAVCVCVYELILRFTYSNRRACDDHPCAPHTSDSVNSVFVELRLAPVSNTQLVREPVRPAEDTHRLCKGWGTISYRDRSQIYIWHFSWIWINLLI